MAFASAEEIAKSGAIYGVRTAEAAQELLAKELARALDNRQGCKDYRPWDIVNFDKILDRKQAWIGFEFETGFDNKNEYQKFIRHLWDQKYTAIDKEGTGNYPVEVAYAPMHLADVKAGKSTLRQSVEFMRKNNLTPALNPTTFTRRDVGIHAGISSPAMLACHDKYELCSRLNRALLSLNDKQRVKVYGRSALHWGGAHNRRAYFEIKVFKAIPTVEHVKMVERVTINIVKLMDYLAANEEAAPSSAAVFKFLSSARPALSWLKE